MSGYVAALSGMKVVSELAAADPRVVLVSQDFGPVRGFTERFPERHLDVGISEENLIGVAAGLAHAGKLPFVSAWRRSSPCAASNRSATTVRTIGTR
jgi:transketolase C-terminal domain/subunit